MTAAPIDILAGLKIQRPRTPGARCVVEWSAPTLAFTADATVIAGELAQAYCDAIRELLAGMPAAPAATLQRRRYRVEQAGRGGEPAGWSSVGGHLDADERREAKRRYFERFRAPKMGLVEPRPGETRQGTESGMLAQSLVSEMFAPGQFRVYFAGPRARLDRTGENAVLRVFKKFPSLLKDAAKSATFMRALDRAREQLFGKGTLALLRSAVSTAGAVQDLAEDLEREVRG